MVETNPADLLHELLAELLRVERVEIADIGPEELLSDHGMGSLRLIAAAQRLGSWETLPRGSGVCTLDTIGTGEVEAGVGFTTGRTPPGPQDETGAYPKTFKLRRFLHPAKLAAYYLPDSFEVHQTTQ